MDAGAAKDDDVVVLRAPTSKEQAFIAEVLKGETYAEAYRRCYKADSMSNTAILNTVII